MLNYIEESKNKGFAVHDYIFVSEITYENTLLVTCTSNCDIDVRISSSILGVGLCKEESADTLLQLTPELLTALRVDDTVEALPCSDNNSCSSSRIGSFFIH